MFRKKQIKNWITDLAIQLWIVALPSFLLFSFSTGGGADDDEFDIDIPRSVQPMPMEPSNSNLKSQVSYLIYTTLA